MSFRDRPHYQLGNHQSVLKEVDKQAHRNKCQLIKDMLFILFLRLMRRSSSLRVYYAQAG
jgi:hypothetical protein